MIRSLRDCSDVRQPARTHPDHFGDSAGGAGRKTAAAGRKTAAGGRKGAATGRKVAAGRKAATAGRKTATAGRKAAAGRSAGKARGAATGRAAGATARPSSRSSAAGAKKKKAPASRSGRSAPPRAAGARNATVPVRKAPSLDRARRVVRDDEDEDIVHETPPSSLDLDRTASSARSGRRSLRERYNEHTETSPALTAGDVDADWESAYSVGDEAPGGDNPTPDQDIVDEIGRAVGVEYQDNEELKGADKVAKRDKNRWELDPASSEDWDER